MKQKEIELFRGEDGFYAARELKDGSLSADKHKISGEEIMTMFTEFFVDYCKESGQTKLLMQDGDGQLFVTMRVETKKQKADGNKAQDAAPGNGKKPAAKKPKKPRKAK
ncbi:MAG: hypothetical protein K6F74_05675 [Prevotella sp.]|nr:hypothetical protein [Prevotella sp.]